MVHCNNCTNDTNAWAGVLKETAELFGASPDTGEVFTKLYEKSLEDYLSKHVFAGVAGSTIEPDPADVAGFNAYIKSYQALLAVERAAVETL